VKTLRAFDQQVSAVAFSGKAIHFCTAGGNVAKLYSLKKMDKAPIEVHHNLGETIVDISFDKFGAYMLTGSSTKATIWKVGDMSQSIHTIQAHSDKCTGVKIDPTGSYIATVSEDKFLKIF
jgi:WD40 repeat protein